MHVIAGSLGFASTEDLLIVLGDGGLFEGRKDSNANFCIRLPRPPIHIQDRSESAVNEVIPKSMY
jgi:hypothetical protein